MAFLATLLRAVPLGRESLDDDETWSWNALSQPFPAMMQTVREDKTHPPLYYLLLKPYGLAAGMSEGALRAPSVVAGAATSGIVTIAAAALAGSTPAGLVAGAIMASLDKQVYFGQQLRSYALYTLLVLCILCSVAILLRDPDDRRRWVALGAVALLATQTHYLALLYLAAAGLVLLATPSLRRLVPRYILAMVPAGVALVAWFVYIAPYLRKTGLGNIAWIPRPGP